MKSKKISFYDNFKCLGSNCPDTCCKGWIIPLNDDDLSLYHSQKGLLLMRLLLAEGKQNGISCLNKNSGVCSFLDKDRLCSLQRNYGEDFLCNTCKVYPRNMSNYGDFLHLTLDLSCPEVSRLFVENIDNINYVESQDDISIPLSTTNDDTDFLKNLLTHENYIHNFINDTTHNLSYIYSSLINYAIALQNEYIVNPENTFIKEAPVLSAKEGLSFDALTIDKLLHSRFYHKKLKKTDPKLYTLMKIYENKIAGLSIKEADDIISKIPDILTDYYADTDKLLRAYLSYLLKDTFLGIYEDYSFRKCIVQAIMHTQLIALFLYLEGTSKGTLTKEDVAVIISVYDKRARHNSQISDKMYDVLKEI